MKKEYNRNTLTDMPLDASFTATTSSTQRSTVKTTKPKINAIGKKATNELKGKTTKTTKSSTKTTQTTSQKLKTQITKTNEKLTDLEKLNEENIKTYRAKSKRNMVVIILLVIALIAAVATISVYLVITKLETNCNLYVYGANAVYVVEGEELNEFRTPADLRGNSILKLDLNLKINEEGSYNIKFKPECFQNGTLMENTLIYEANLELFYESQDGFYYSKSPIDGNQTIKLCEGIILDYYYQNSLNVDNFNLKFHTYLERV